MATDIKELISQKKNLKVRMNTKLLHKKLRKKKLVISYLTRVIRNHNVKKLKFRELGKKMKAKFKIRFQKNSKIIKNKE